MARYFSEWLVTRLSEDGWPRTQGLLRRKRFYTEGAIVSALQDAVRIALAIGCELPSSAMDVAVTYVEPAPTPSKAEVDCWIEGACEMGARKIAAFDDLRPKWIKLCSFNLVDQTGNASVRLWQAIGDRFEEDTADFDQALRNAESLAVIAMCWALKNSDAARDALADYPGRDDDPPELRALSPLAAWLEMAKVSLSIYASAIGLPSYEDPDTWSNFS